MAVEVGGVAVVEATVVVAKVVVTVPVAVETIVAVDPPEVTVVTPLGVVSELTDEVVVDVEDTTAVVVDWELEVALEAV